MVNERYTRDSDPIDNGSYGDVYRAYDKLSKDYVAIKFLRYTDQKILLRFKREIEILKQVNHPNIIEIIDFCLENPEYYVMPLADETLEEAVIKLSSKEKWDISIQIAEGLNHAHLFPISGPIIHRDLKPSNVLIFYKNETQRAVISDFGGAKRISSIGQTKTGENIGTWGYMAPELINNAKEADEISDIYSYGMILYKIFTNEDPYGPIDIARVPPDIQYIILKCTKPNREERYGCMDEVLNELKDNSEEYINQIEIITSIIIEEEKSSSPQNRELLLKRMIENSKNSSLYLQIFPLINQNLLLTLMIEYTSEFRIIIFRYIKFLSKNSDYNYFKRIVLTLFYIYKNSNDTEVKEKIIDFLLWMGYGPNTYAAIDACIEIIKNLTTDDKIMINIISNIFRNNQDIKNFYKDRLLEENIPEMIKKTLQVEGE